MTRTPRIPPTWVPVPGQAVEVAPAPAAMTSTWGEVLDTYLGGAPPLVVVDLSSQSRLLVAFSPDRWGRWTTADGALHLRPGDPKRLGAPREDLLLAGPK